MAGLGRGELSLGVGWTREDAGERSGGEKRVIVVLVKVLKNYRKVAIPNSKKNRLCEV